VRELVEAILSAWGQGRWSHTPVEQKPESHTLRLSIEKAGALLGWQPRWSFARAVTETVAWYRADAQGASAEALRALSLEQWSAYGAGPS
jgi:CDP-glucose 4,6-dehydratase